MNSNNRFSASEKDREIKLIEFIFFQRPSEPFIPSYMTALNHQVDVSDILTNAVDRSNKTYEPSNKSSDLSNKTVVDSNNTFRESSKKSAKTFFVRIHHPGFDEDYIQVCFDTHV
jgi:hypothetical protein